MKHRFLFLAGVLAATALAHGADVGEVVVSGARLDAMRLQILRLEDQFYGRYNALNKDDDYDIQCITRARTGTRLVTRSCRPAFESIAVQEEASARSTTMGGVSRGAMVTPAASRIEIRRSEFQQNMKDLTARDPELARLLRERGELTAQYESMRRGMFGAKPPPETDINVAR
jgi:hypothetical protein